MKIAFSSIFVDDQAKALAFYVEKLGFVKAQDILMGPARWLTVTAPEGADSGVFRTPPTGMGPVTIAMFDETCGNWIQLQEVMAGARLD